MAILPARLAPMKATTGELPNGDGWSYEVKWDGMRALAFVEDGEVRIQSTNLLDVTSSWPELAGLAEALGPRPVLLDGEIVATGDDGRPSFGRLQQRMHVAAAAEARRRAALVAVRYVVFDLLQLGPHPLVDLPLAERRRLLGELVEPGPAWTCSPAYPDGEALLDAARAQGLEGVVAKRDDSPYLPGRRTRTWLKVKVRRRQELVVGGWVPGEGRRAEGLGALLVGYHEPGGGPLRFAGGVGTGFSDGDLDRLARLLAPLATDRPPFEPVPTRTELRRPPRWVRPELVAEVEFGEWSDGGKLRHPSFLGLRNDKDPADVVREGP
ncbi:MAG: non-homologous end-joining DNA ligase [Acidimicrobiia bacterium]